MRANYKYAPHFILLAVFLFSLFSGLIALKTGYFRSFINWKNIYEDEQAKTIGILLIAVSFVSLAVLLKIVFF